MSLSCNESCNESVGLSSKPLQVLMSNLPLPDIAWEDFPAILKLHGNILKLLRNPWKFTHRFMQKCRVLLWCNSFNLFCSVLPLTFPNSIAVYASLIVEEECEEILVEPMVPLCVSAEFWSERWERLLWHIYCNSNQTWHALVTDVEEYHVLKEMFKKKIFHTWQYPVSW